MLTYILGGNLHDEIHFFMYNWLFCIIGTWITDYKKIHFLQNILYLFTGICYIRNIVLTNKIPIFTIYSYNPHIDHKNLCYVLWVSSKKRFVMNRFFIYQYIFFKILLIFIFINIFIITIEIPKNIIINI